MKNITRLLIALALVIIAMPSLRADDHSLYLYYNTGQIVEMKFSDRPVLSFIGTDKVMIKDKNMKVISEYTTTLRKLGFSEPKGNPDAIEDAVIADGAIVSESAKVMRLIGFAEGTDLTVTSYAGITMISDTIGQGDYVLDLDTYAPGVYIISAGNVTCKIALK